MCLPVRNDQEENQEDDELKDKNQLPHLPGDSLSSAILGVPGFGGEFYLYVFISLGHYKDDITLPRPPLT